MKKHPSRSFLISASVGALLVVFETPAPAQQPAVTPGGSPEANRATVPSTRPSPPLADGKPDFSGVWASDQHFRQDLSEAGNLPLQPWALKLTKERLSNDDPEANCLPTGVPRLSPYPWRIIQTPTHIFFLFEGNIHSYRQIFMDRRKDVNPTWFGESIGKWDGDTLIIDTTGFNDKFWFDFARHPPWSKRER